MKNFSELNRHKLPFAFISVALVFTGMALIAFLLLFVNTGKFAESDLLILVFGTTIIVAPILILVLASADWAVQRKNRVKALQITPFNEIGKIGFVTVNLNEKSKWHFTEEIKEATINGFRVQCNISRKSSGIVTFKACVEHKPIDKKTFAALEVKFRDNDIYFEPGAITWNYNLKRLPQLSIEGLKSELNNFVNMLGQYKFEAANPEAGEKSAILY